MQHITHLNPDCLGLSEIDAPMHKAIADALKTIGYNDYFSDKKNPIMGGSAIYFKKDKFACLEKY